MIPYYFHQISPPMKKDPTEDQISKLKRKEKYLEAINTFATVLFETQTVDEIVWAVTKNAISQLGYYDCVIYLYDSERNRLVQRAAFGPKNPKEKEIIALTEILPSQGIAGSVFESGKAEIIADTSLDSRYLIDDEVRYSEISVPLFYKGKTIGVIDSEHPEKNYFTEEDLDILITISTMVSTKIAQAEATEKLLQYQENLEDLIETKTKELEETNQILIEQNKEKELLIKEIHHRVKNNMQIMNSLANLQMQASDDKKVQESLKQFSSRIRSMALIHDRLYYGTNISAIQLDTYIIELVKNIIDSFNKRSHIKLVLELDSIFLDLDYAVPLGLIVNELVTNSIKHAFDKESNPEISIKIQNEKEHAKLVYSDNGTGITKESAVEGSFGMELIAVLAEQIGFDMVQRSKDGFCFSMKFNV